MAQATNTTALGSLIVWIGEVIATLSGAPDDNDGLEERIDEEVRAILCLTPDHDSIDPSNINSNLIDRVLQLAAQVEKTGERFEDSQLDNIAKRVALCVQQKLRVIVRAYTGEVHKAYPADSYPVRTYEKIIQHLDESSTREDDEL